MWTRADLKTKGKQTFLGNYWTTVGCLFAISVIPDTPAEMTEITGQQ